MTRAEPARGSWIALLVSLLAPGLGHGVAGRPGRGTLWLLGLFWCWSISVVIAYFWLPALAIGVALTPLFTLACAIDAFRAERRSIRASGWIGLGSVAALTLLVLPVVLPVGIRAFVVEAFEIPGGGMCPTLGIGDHVFVDKTVLRSRPPEPGDLLVHRAGPNVVYIKRVVAVGGDRVSVSHGRVSVNGQAAPLRALGTRGCDGLELFEEELGNRHSITLEDQPQDEATDTVVPAGELFLLGDNRPNSFDSRRQGTVATDDVIGIATRVWIANGKPTWRELR
jgi:signal peptidase I